MFFGSEYSDQVCLDLQDSCVNSFSYFMILNETGIVEPFDGILGLGRNKQLKFGDGNETIGPLFIDSLVSSGKITDPRFSFSYGYSNETFIDFGKP